MSIIDEALEANRNYAKTYDPTLGKRPAPKIAVVTCMDPRLSDLPGILGLPHADLDVIRTGGPAVTEDVLGELVVSNRVLGTKEILLLNHTGCGFTTFTDDELNAKLSASTGDASPAPMRFFSYLIRTPSKIPGSRSEKSGRIPGLRKKFPCAALFSRWTRADCGKSSNSKTRAASDSRPLFFVQQRRLVRLLAGRDRFGARNNARAKGSFTQLLILIRS
jgi:carbonic anhydrase